MTATQGGQPIAAISLWQPWAGLLMAGIKVHETRSWRPPVYMLGQRVAIHAAKKVVVIRTMSDGFRAVVDKAGTAGLEFPRGVLLGTARLVYVLPTRLIRGERWIISGDRIIDIDPADRLCGDWVPGRFAWKFDDHEPLKRPVAYRGAQRIFYVPMSLL